MSLLGSPLPHIHGRSIGKHEESVTASTIITVPPVALTGGSDCVSMWCLQKKTLIRVFHCGVYDCSISACGKIIATTCRDGFLRLWSGVDGRCLQKIQYSTDIKSKACWVSTSGGSIIFVNNNCAMMKSEIVVYDWFDDGCASFRYKIIRATRIERLKVVSNDVIAFKCQSMLYVYSLSRRCSLNSYDLSYYDTHLKFDFALTEKRVVTACDTLVVRFHEKDIVDIKLPDYNPPKKERLCDISDDGNIVTAACCDGSFGVWCVSSRRRLFVLASAGSDPRTCSLSWINKRLIVGYSNGQVQLFNLKRSKHVKNTILKCANAVEAADGDIQAETKCVAMKFIVEADQFINNIKSLLDSSDLSGEDVSEGLRKEIRNVCELANSDACKIEARATRN